MRVSELEKNVIIDAVKSSDPAARVWLFGSRVDDSTGEQATVTDSYYISSMTASEKRFSTKGYWSAAPVSVKMQYPAFL